MMQHVLQIFMFLMKRKNYAGRKRWSGAVAHVSGETEGSALHSRALEPNAATQPSTLLSDTRLRAEIDAGAQDVVEVLTAVGGGGGDGGERRVFVR